MTSEPQVEAIVRRLPSGSGTSLVMVVVILRGKPGSTPSRWTSMRSTLFWHLFSPKATSVATTTPLLLLFFGLRHSGITDSSIYQPSVLLSELREHAPGVAMRFSWVMM